jgi:transcription termination factor NusB
MNAPRKSIQKKYHARLAAAQALYGHAIEPTKRGAAAMAAVMLDQWADSKANGDNALPTDAMPDAPLLGAILDSALQHADAISDAIDAIILPGWSRERTSLVLVAILQAAGGEALSPRGTPRAVLIHEYVDVAGSLLNDDETGFIHKALNLMLDRLVPQKA